jgi:hypothetical protein
MSIKHNDTVRLVEIFAANPHLSKIKAGNVTIETHSPIKLDESEILKNKVNELEGRLKAIEDKINTPWHKRMWRWIKQKVTSLKTVDSWVKFLIGLIKFIIAPSTAIVTVVRYWKQICEFVRQWF